MKIIPHRLFNYLILSHSRNLNKIPLQIANANQPQVRRMTLQANHSDKVKYLSQNEAIDLDQELFNEFGFSVDQLMELAGLAVATAVARSYPPGDYGRPIVCCGPGNNGGDGLVCARHLKMFGYLPTIVCPKPGRNQLYQNLLIQCDKYGIEIVNEVTEEWWSLAGFNLMIDSIFGFSFKPPNRNEDFARLLNLMHKSSDRIPLVSVDIPSGWHVENGPASMKADQIGLDAELKIPILKPECLVSLTAPKRCASQFTGRFHYLGGRFCPKSLEEKYQLNLPEYPSTDGIVLL